MMCLIPDEKAGIGSQHSLLLLHFRATWGSLPFLPPTYQSFRRTLERRESIVLLMTTNAIAAHWVFPPGPNPEILYFSNFYWPTMSGILTQQCGVHKLACLTTRYDISRIQHTSHHYRTGHKMPDSGHTKELVQTSTKSTRIEERESYN